MEKLKKFAFFREIPDGRRTAEEYAQKKDELDRRMQERQVVQCRAYIQEIERKWYLFHFFETDGNTGALNWPGNQARHVYEFKLHENDDLSGLASAGIIIGVAEGRLDEYVRLHDEQPQIIHDLCYQNGFRKSSIFAFEAAPDDYYLLQFQEFKGQEDPKLYENPVYQEWLRVTGECQRPLPGESFWKKMDEIYVYKKNGGTIL